MSSIASAPTTSHYEVLVIGGGAAGLSAALTLGRLRRTVLVCDDGKPRNAPAQHMNNFPGFDGVAPELWRKQVQQNLEKYPTVHRQSDRVTEVNATAEGFIARLQSGAEITANKILLAYGVKDRLPALENIEKLWGDTVVHCPYCHGFEFQDQAIGLLANGQPNNGDMLAHMVSLLLGLSADVKVFNQGPSQLSEAQAQAFANQQVSVIETPVIALEHNAQKKLSALVLNTGERVARDVLYLMPSFPFERSASLGESLGCAVNEMGWYVADEKGHTTVPGVYAAGDIAGMAGQSVLNSAMSGSMAAAMMCSELLAKKAGL
jgi:thioredoxin reductase